MSPVLCVEGAPALIVFTAAGNVLMMTAARMRGVCHRVDLWTRVEQTVHIEMFTHNTLTNTNTTMTAFSFRIGGY